MERKNVKTMRTLSIGLVALALLAPVGPLGMTASGAEPAPDIQGIAVPQSGDMQIQFRGGNGPFTVQKRLTLDAGSPWVDMPTAKVTALGTNTGVYVAFIPMGEEDAAFYRVISAGETIVELKGWTIQASVSTPANGTHFIAGEAPVVKVKILDNFAAGMTKSSLSTFNLYMYGPEDPTKTVTPLMLGANMGRSGTHHYIKLSTDARVGVNGNELTYTLQPVTTEDPGTYTMGIRATLSGDGFQSVIRYLTIQIGTSVVENKLFATANCAACHLGPVSGKLYMHHVDPGYSPTGSWDLDIDPAMSCKLCHNNNGYAAYTDPVTAAKVPDHIVYRVHGVHMGEELKNYFSTNSSNGTFADYRHVVFPADVRNCTACHTDDRWKTAPTRLACGSCHDTIYFGGDPVPTNMVAHYIRPLVDDTSCSECHAPENNFGDSIAEYHAVPTPPTNHVDVTLSAPANGSYYVAGEKPVVTVVFRDDAGNPFSDHTQVTSGNFSAANLYVYGPRSYAVPALTSKAIYGADTARASVTCSVNGPWNIDGKVFKIGINGNAAQDIVITGTAGAVTAAEVVAVLNAVIEPLGAKASVSGSKVNIKTLIRGTTARITIYNGEVTTAMGWKAKGVTLEPDVTIATLSTVNSDLRSVTVVDPLDFAETNVVRTAANITYQLGDVAGLAPGTYSAFVYQFPATNKLAGFKHVGIGFTTFQVGTSTVEAKITSNCTDCHGDTVMHLYESHVHPAVFDAEYCKACHDYGHLAGGEMFKGQGGTSLNGWSGFGAMPISRRIHGVHFGHYLKHSEEIYANATKETFGGIIFPQDVRNCTKCHVGNDTWKQKPSRIACLACHDSDEAKAHGKLLTLTPDASDPYGPTAMETCNICHGAGSEFSPDKVHAISNPYVPPYPREAAE